MELPQEAITEICHLAFDTLSLKKVYAMVYENNKNSCKVLEKCGFLLEGTLRKSVFKNGEFYDAYLYSFIQPE